jgi:hypothetical protein
MKLETEHTDNKRGVLHIKNPFLKLIKWVENAQKGKTVCKG